MGDVESAALTLAGITLAFLLVVFGVSWMRRPRLAEAAPKMPRASRERRLPTFSRKADPAFDPVEISPERLARISRKTPPPSEPLFDAEPAPEPAAAPVSELIAMSEPIAMFETPDIEAAPSIVTIPSPMIDEAELEAIVSEIAEQVRRIDAPPPAEPPAPVPAFGTTANEIADRASVRLIAQMPPRDAILRKSWLGGRPRLPAALDWPKIDGVDGDFLAQIDCTDLPADLWDGLGPRLGSLAFFAHPDIGAATALHIPADGPPRDPPRKVGGACFRPWKIDSADLAPLAIRAFAEWPVDVRPSDAQLPATNADGIETMLAADYDIADPAFHPFDWPTMLAMAEILESRIARASTDGTAPDDASDELALAIADAAEANREAVIRAQEIIAIIHESAKQGSDFSPGDATAVMAGLHAIRWTSVTTDPDEETGEDQVGVTVLPLTRRHPGADLWVEAYRAILFDHAKHAFAVDPARLSAPARSFFEPLWQEMAGSAVPSLGNFPTRPVAGFDDERDVMMLEIPASGLTSIGAHGGGHLVLTIRKADLALGDFAKLRMLIGS